MKLKPCPFCGGEVKLNKKIRNWDAMIICSKCDFIMYGYTSKQAITAWNKRIK